MGRGNDALDEGQESLLEEHGEKALLDGECVVVIINRDPKLSYQVNQQNQAHLGDIEVSRIQMDFGEFSRKPVTGMEFVDKCGHTHRIRRPFVIDHNYVFECIVSKP